MANINKRFRNKGFLCARLTVLVGCFLLVACQAITATPGDQAGTQPEDLSPGSTEIKAVGTTTDTVMQPTWTIPFTVSPTATPSPAEWPVAGMEIRHINDLDLTSGLGVSWVRRNALKWNLVEPVQGMRAWNEVAALDEELSRISSLGMQAILIVRGTPDWAQAVQGQVCGPIKPEALDAFAEFLRDAVVRYSQPPYNVKYWELGNEPDVDPSLVKWTGPFGCWGDKNDADYYGGGYYAAMLKVAYPAIKSINPEAQVVLGGLLLDCDPVRPPETSPGSGQLRYCTPSRYLEGVLVNGGGDYFDGVSFHAYDYYKGAEGQYANGNWYSAWNTTGPVMAAKANYLRAILAAHGQAEKFLMNTENAILCGRDGTEADCQTDTFNLTKAYYVVQSSVMAMAEGLRANIWYDLQGWRGTAMIDVNRQPLPAYLAYQFNNEMLAGVTYWGRVSTSDGVSGYEFRQGDRVLWVVWSLDGSSHELLLPDSVVAVYDVFGQALPAGQSLNLTLSPMYIEWVASQP